VIFGILGFWGLVKLDPGIEKHLLSWAMTHI